MAAADDYALAAVRLNLAMAAGTIGGPAVREEVEARRHLLALVKERA